MWYKKTLWTLCLPLKILFFISVPDCRKQRWKKCFFVTFIMSLVWLTALSYLMVWMITIIGKLSPLKVYSFITSIHVQPDSCLLQYNYYYRWVISLKVYSFITRIHVQPDSCLLQYDYYYRWVISLKVYSFITSIHVQPDSCLLQYDYFYRWVISP